MKNGTIAVILTAGKGTRLGDYCKTLNKALLPINGKAVISDIIERFPIDTEFVIGLGHRAEQVRDYLNAAHPDTRFEFVEVDNYDGEGSGPGYSLMQCRRFLQCPFYFVSCDTLWNNPIDWQDTGNWLGISKEIFTEESDSYLNLKIENDRVVALRDKEKVEGPGWHTFVGLCHIHDFGIFWDALKEDELKAGEHQISNGLQSLITRGVANAKEIDWMDIGDREKYTKAVLQYEDYDFSKLNESLYFSNNRVIKRFADLSITDKRVRKAQLNPGVFPQIIYHKGEFYAYELQPGQTLYQHNSPRIFNKLLQWLELNLWKKANVSHAIFQKACLKFYRDKTLDRVRMYNEKYSEPSGHSVINGRKIPSAGDLLEEISWDVLSDGVPVFFHGDLQFDNILYQEESDVFMLLDWRQDFAGHVEFGDLYYDLAKLYGGILLNYDLIKMNLLQYEENEDEIFFDFAQRYQTSSYLESLGNYILGGGYNLSKVKLLIGLIYLNMSPLHNYPFDKMLHALGREILNAELRQN